jgi:signal transduction histidine kinase
VKQLRIVWRLTWWYTGALLATLVLAGLATVWGAEASLREVMLHRLQVDALAFERRAGALGVPGAAGTAGSRDRRPPLPVTSPVLVERLGPVMAQVTAADGRVVNRSPALGGSPLPPAPEPGELAVVRFNGAQWAVVEDGFATPAGTYRLELAAPWGPTASILSRLRGILVVVGLGGAAAAVAGGALLARATLARVDAIRRTADEIGASDLTKRLPLRGTRDELDRMAASFNAMLDRVEEAYRRQADFVADASHELRTPTTIIRGLSDLLLRWGASDAEVLRESLEGIRRQADYLGRLVHDLLVLARGGTLDPAQREVIDLSELAAVAVAESRPAAGGRRLSLEPREPAPVRADPLRLHQVLGALLDNALRYTAEDGHIRVGVSTRPGTALLEVEDDGPGIAPADLPRVFDRFYRGRALARDGRGGAGLGLSIARAIAAEHGGTIDAWSEPGRGTRISVALPLHGCGAAAKPQLGEPAAGNGAAALPPQRTGGATLR